MSPNITKHNDESKEILRDWKLSKVLSEASILASYAEDDEESESIMEAAKLIADSITIENIEQDIKDKEEADANPRELTTLEKLMSGNIGK